MMNSKKTIVIAIALLVVAAVLVGFQQAGTTVLTSTQPEQTPEPQRARVIAVKFHADWCGYCKSMGPVFEELQAKYDQEPVLFVEFDQTREFGRRQAKYMAHALRLDDLWQENGGKTGFVLLIDADSRKVLARLTHDKNLKQMGTALQEAVRSAS